MTPGDRDAFPTSDTFASGDNFTFSPDGKFLVFTAVPAKDEAWSTNYDICRVSIDNKSKDWESLTKDNPAADSAPAFSPDGTKLAYRAAEEAGLRGRQVESAGRRCAAGRGVVTAQPEACTDRFDLSADEFVWRNDKAVAVRRRPRTTRHRPIRIGQRRRQTDSTDRSGWGRARPPAHVRSSRKRHALALRAMPA